MPLPTPGPWDRDRRRTLALAALAAVAGAAPAAHAQEQKKQPPPEFSEGYTPPMPSQPQPRMPWLTTLDVALLAAALGLAAWIGLHRRSRREMRLLGLFSVLYFGFIRQGCICPVGSIQNVALAALGSGYALPFAAGALFLLPLLAALFFGRVFCGAVCPLGAIQDLALLWPRRVPAWLDNALGVLPYAVLGIGVLYAAAGTAFVVCQFDPFVGFFRFSGGWLAISLGAGLLMLGTVVGRPYCRWLCPYSVLLRWTAALTRWGVRITPKDCIQCHLCADACPFGAISPATLEAPAEPRAVARRRLGRVLAVAPLIVVAGALLGRLGAPAVARYDRVVSLAERVYQEETGRVKGQTNASEAFRKQATPTGELYRQALVKRRWYGGATTLFGAWCGIVVAGKLIFLTLRRRRPDYEADQAACLSCARCYTSCPIEQERLTGLRSPLRDAPEQP